ncbi:MAG TPA: hypothetical protein VIJ75_18220 [Hanamia sp.]
MDTRREFLKKAMLLSGASSVANVIPSSIQKALAINPQAGSTYLDAEHVVILMQENSPLIIVLVRYAVYVVLMIQGQLHCPTKT